jgi:uncharacterized protein (TIGR02246 family)
MKTISFLFLAILIARVSVGQSSQDEQLVKKVIIAFQNDFNEGSFKNAVNYSTNDWEHFNPGGGTTKGRDEVLKEVRSVHQTFLKGVSMTIESVAIRFIAPNVAIADVIHKISTYELPKEVKHEKERQLKTYIVVRQKGKWLLTHDQNTVIARP